MITLLRTTSHNKDFIELVKLLDAYLADKDGDDHAFYAQYNKIDAINHVVIAYLDSVPTGCGAIKEYENEVMEVKRMYTLPGSRGRGVASSVIKELEQWAVELAYKKCVLETGKKQTEAVALYNKSGYTLIPNYGQYAGVDDSVCFEKSL
jgi:putative acetyltransferase